MANCVKHHLNDRVKGAQMEHLKAALQWVAIPDLRAEASMFESNKD
jgi:hypothetical protein